MKIEQSTTASCRPEHVWQVFTDAASWRGWNPMLANAQWVSGEPWQPGSELLLEGNQPSFKLKAKVKEAVAPNHIQWTGGAMGVSVVHTFYFLAQPDGSTMIKTLVELSGAALFFVNEEMKKKGVGMLTAWLESLKTESERISSSQ